MAPLGLLKLSITNSEDADKNEVACVWKSEAIPLKERQVDATSVICSVRAYP